MAYVTPDELAPYLGGKIDPARAALACDAASIHIDMRTGTTFQDPFPPTIRTAAMIAAVRFYQDPSAPFGTVGGQAGDVPLYAKTPIPDVDALLLGFRKSFGIA